LRRKYVTEEDGERRYTTDAKDPTNGVTMEGKRRTVPIYGVDRPFFHVDLVDAVDAAVRDAKKRDEDWRTCAPSATSHGNDAV